MRITGRYAEGMVNLRLAGGTLRVFIKPWAWPYAETYLNMRLFGAGPIGFMWWGL